MMELREWQDKALSYFSENHNCIIEAATGTGKSYFTVSAILHILEKAPETSILIIVPKNVILEDTWYRELSDKISIRHIGIFYGDIKEKAQITLTNTHNIEKVGYDDYDFVIWDELHNAYSDRLLTYLQKPKEYKLGLTATLSRNDMKHWKAMKHFGFNVFRYGLDAAIEDEVLNMYRFHNILMSLESSDMEIYEEVSQKLRLYSQMKKQGTWNSEMQLAKYKLLDQRKSLLGKSSQKIKVFRAIQQSLLRRKVIVFNEYNAMASECYWELTDLGFKPCIFNSDIPKEIRNESLKGYRKDKFDTIITTRALDEGYNLPKIDVAVILCGGSSSRQMIQRAGRVLRKKESMTDIYQVFFRDTVEEDYAMKRYDLMKKSCMSYDEMVI